MVFQAWYTMVIYCHCIVVTMVNISFQNIRWYQHRMPVNYHGRKINNIGSTGLSYKTFYGCNLRIFVISQSVCPSHAFQPSQMFVGEARAYPSEALLRCSTQGWAPCHAHKQQTRLERLFRSKHSSLFKKLVNYDCKKYYRICPRFLSNMVLFCPLLSLGDATQLRWFIFGLVIEANCGPSPRA